MKAVEFQMCELILVWTETLVIIAVTLSLFPFHGSVVIVWTAERNGRRDGPLGGEYHLDSLKYEENMTQNSRRRIGYEYKILKHISIYSLDIVLTFDVHSTCRLFGA